MRSPIPPICALALLALGLSSCQSSTSSTAPSPEPPADTQATPSQNPIPTTAYMDPATGTGQEALAVYWLERDPALPLTATLTPARTLTASQGDLYALSVRPFMGPEHLKLTRTVAAGEATDYTIEFTHPVPMPADLARPASATKRLDLFLFDVQAVLVVPGPDTYFSEAIRLHRDALQNAHGFRHLARLVDLPALGITDGTNTFPYRLLANPITGLPEGNYTADNGWIADAILEPRGYDVLAQGDWAETVLRVPNDLTGPVAVCVVAKYMDPRGGATSEEKRLNRLPDPANLASFRYFLPEACGDLQQIEQTGVTGAVRADAALAKATLQFRVLDWDHGATVAETFPDHTWPSRIRQPSQPTGILASFPTLNADDPFPGVLGATSGQIGEFVDVAIDIYNTDLLFDPASPTGDVALGLIRLEDAQDLQGSTMVVLDPAQLPVDGDWGRVLNARYQLASTVVAPAMTIALEGELKQRPTATFQPRVVVTNGPATEILWNFGGHATPNYPTVSAPVVQLHDVEADIACSVTVRHLDATVTLPFIVSTHLPSPTLPADPYNYAALDLPRHFTDLDHPHGIVVTADNEPASNPVTDAGATLGRVLFHDVRLSKNYGTSCASCHKQTKGFADSVSRSTGWNGETTLRNSMSLANVRYFANGKMFADQRAATLEEQALMPIQDHIEMGLTLPALMTRLNDQPFYPPLFEAAFGSPEINEDGVAKALAQFMRSIVSYRSKFDVAMTAGPEGLPDFPSVFTDVELRGLAIYQGFPGVPAPNMRCNQCHATAVQTMGAALQPGATSDGPFVANNGLVAGAYQGQPSPNDEFKSPSLRNIERTAPYMHDGRFSTLEQVVNFYAVGVRAHPNLHRFLRVGDDPEGQPEKFTLSTLDIQSLVAFLKTLTDVPLATDPKYSDPFADS